MHILLVDDDELIAQTVAWLLESLGHRVAMASSGNEALDRLRGGLQPDLLILDQNMPGLTGLETLAQARTLLPDVPVFLATGYRDGQLEASVLAHARTLVLHKPIKLADFRLAFAELEGFGDRPSAD